MSWKLTAYWAAYWRKKHNGEYSEYDTGMVRYPPYDSECSRMYGTVRYLTIFGNRHLRMRVRTFRWKDTSIHNTVILVCISIFKFMYGIIFYVFYQEVVLNSLFHFSYNLSSTKLKKIIPIMVLHIIVV